MIFRVQETGAFVNEQSFREMHPNVSFPTFINDIVANDFGADKVHLTPQPALSPFQTAAYTYEQDPADGKWKQVWIITDIDDVDQLALIRASEEKKLTDSYVQEIQLMMDTKAREKGYDDIKSAALRAAFIGPWQEEGKAYGSWMDSCWGMCYQIMADVKNNLRAQPTVAEVLAELPVLVLPSAG